MSTCNLPVDLHLGVLVYTLEVEPQLAVRVFVAEVESLLVYSYSRRIVPAVVAGWSVAVYG